METETPAPRVRIPSVSQFPAASTSINLLQRVRGAPTDQAAWAEFVRRYGSQILHWCRHWKLQEADAQDITQTVLVKLCEKMRDFEYDAGQSFRAYVKTLTRYAWCDLRRTRRRMPGQGSGDSNILELLESIAARDDLEDRLAQAADIALFEEAATQVRLRVQPHTWEAFRLTALEGASGASVAAQLGMEVATVFKAKSKVCRMLQEQIQQLQGL